MASGYCPAVMGGGSSGARLGRSGQVHRHLAPPKALHLVSQFVQCLAPAVPLLPERVSVGLAGKDHDGGIDALRFLDQRERDEAGSPLQDGEELGSRARASPWTGTGLPCGG